MTSVSFADHHQDDQHHIDILNDDVVESELDKMLPSNLNNARDYHLTLGRNKNAGLNEKDNRNHDNNNTSRSSSLFNSVKSPLSSVRRPLSTDESDDGYRIVKNKKKQKQVTNDELQALNVDDASRFNPTIMNSAGVDPDHNQTHAINDNQHRPSHNNFVITNESTRYAQTRYPFPPFVLRFNAGKVTVNQVKESVIDHCKNNHQFDVQVINCRLSFHVNSNNEYDVLIFVKDVVSFSFLLDESHRPRVIGNKSFYFASTPVIPPQLCLLIKNVDLRIDFDEFCNDIRTSYPHVKNIIRMKNKFQNDTSSAA